MKNSENAFKIVTAETQYLQISFKSRKVAQIWTTVKYLIQKEIFLLFPSRYTKHAYDILSKKFIEDSVPITTTSETLKREGVFAGNIHEMFSLHEVLAYWQWQLHLTVTYQHLVCHFVKETLSLKIVIYLILFLYVCHHRSRVMEGNLRFRDWWKYPNYCHELDKTHTVERTVTCSAFVKQHAWCFSFDFDFSGWLLDSGSLFCLIGSNSLSVTNSRYRFFPTLSDVLTVSTTEGNIMSWVSRTSRSLVDSWKGFPISVIVVDSDFTCFSNAFCTPFPLC